MRVLIDCRTVSERMDGLGRYTLGLVSALLQLPTDTDIGLVVPARMSHAHPLQVVLRKHRPSLLPVSAELMSPSAQTQVPGVVRRYRPNVFHYPHFNLPLLTPGRVVVTIHDLGPLTEPNYFPRAAIAKRAYFRTAAAFSARRAAAVITPTNAVAESVRRLLWDEAAVSSIAEGVDDAFLRAPTEGELNAFRSTHDLRLPYILYVGVQRPRKNLPRLIEAFARVVHQIPHELVLVGQPIGATEALDQVIARHHVARRVRHLGYLPEGDIRSAYAAADAFVLCSTLEGFGLGVIEAMCSGTPVITTGWGATAEVADDAALLIDAYSVDDIAAALLRVTTDGALRDELRARGYERARHFTWSRAAQRTLDLYAAVSR